MVQWSWECSRSIEGVSKDGYVVSCMKEYLASTHTFFFVKSCIFPLLLKKNKVLECLSSFQRSRVNYLQGRQEKEAIFHI